MYSPDQVWRGIRLPRRAFLEAWRLYNRRVRGRTGIEVMAADWDTLVVLDACRYDLFTEINDIEGEPRTRPARRPVVARRCRQPVSRDLRPRERLRALWY